MSGPKIPEQNIKAKLRITLLCTVLALAASALAYPSGLQAAAGGSRKATIELIQLYRSVAGKPRAQICPVYGELEQRFNLPVMTWRALQPVRESQGEAPARKLQATFIELIRIVTFRDTSDFFEKNEYTLSKERLDGNRKQATVTASLYLAEEDMDIDIGFVWERDKGQWRVVDLRLDGDSLVTDYRNQFARVLQKEGFAGLQKKLQDKLATEKAAGSVCVQ